MAQPFPVHGLRKRARVLLYRFICVEEFQIWVQNIFYGVAETDNLVQHEEVRRAKV